MKEKGTFQFILVQDPTASIPQFRIEPKAKALEQYLHGNKSRSSETTNGYDEELED